MMPKLAARLPKIISSYFSIGAIAAMGFLVDTVTAKPSFSAEQIRFYGDAPVAVSFSLDALEKFARTGAAEGDLQLVTRFFDEPTLATLRKQLQRRFPLDVEQTYHFSYSPLGREVLEQAGKVLRFSPETNGFYGLRAAAIAAAANAPPEGWTLIDAMREFPTDSLDINVEDLLKLRRELTLYFNYSDAAVRAITERANEESSSEVSPALNELTNLSQKGAYSFQRETITIANPALRQTERGLSVNYDFPVDVYIPQGIEQPAPIVIVSHGFGAVKENFAFIAQHLASHGFVVLVPDHVGSNLSYRQSYLQGQLNTLLSPIEFINRPQEISFLIDELERLVASNPYWANLLNLSQIGVMGNSLGGSTALSLAGAEINYDRLIETCDRDNLILNFSLYLQCRARFLPPQNFDLYDPRIKAAIASHPLSSGLFGPEGMSEIGIPLLITAGSQDVVSPVITEQIHPFVWLQSEPKYLALFDPGTHFATSEQNATGAASIPEVLRGKHQEWGRKYFKVMNVAFFNAYLRERSEFLPYLSAAAARTMSKGNPMQLNVIRELSPKDLRTAYGRKPPIPIVPPSVASKTQIRDRTIVEEIKRTGVLKVAMRRDVPPLGYINRQDEWTGYCGDLAVALREYLTSKLEFEDVELELAELPSTQQNRFSLVRDNTVYLECGSNIIGRDTNGITFSNPFVATGTRFLSKSSDRQAVNPNRSLEGVKVGVVKNSTTEAFVRQKYPQAEIVPFEGLAAQGDAVRAVMGDRIDTFAHDSLLALAEVLEREIPSEQYTFSPQNPLTCDFYGLLLPGGDPEWRRIINEFMATEQTSQIMETWFAQIAASELNDLEYCFNR